MGRYQMMITNGIVGPAAHRAIERTSINRLSLPSLSQEFLFSTYENDKIEVEIKDKFAKSRPTISRNLGRLRINIPQLLHEVTPG